MTARVTLLAGLLLMLPPFAAMAARVNDSPTLIVNPSPISLSAVMNTYDQRIRQVLPGAFSPQVVARMVVKSGRSAEYAVGLKQNGGRYSIVAYTSPVWIWGYSNIDNYQAGHAGDPPDQLARGLAPLRAGLPARIEDVKPAACEIGIDASLARRLAASWKAVTRLTSPPLLAADGETYDLAFRDGAAELQRSIWSPRPRTPEGDLVGIADTMQAYCGQPRAFKANLTARIDALAAELAKAGH